MGYVAGGAAIGALSGGIGSIAGSAALTASGVTGGILGGVISGAVGGAVGGAITGGLTAGMFGENVFKGAASGALSGAIGGAVIGGVAGGVRQAVSNASALGPKGNMWTGSPVAAGRSSWAINNTVKANTVGAASKVSSSGKIGKLITGKVSGDFEVGAKLDGDKLGESIFKADNGLAAQNQTEIESMVRVRHHTSISGLKGIRNSNFIRASRGEPYGVDVEVSPFISPTKVDMGQFGRGSYIEFSIPKNQISFPPTYMGGEGNAGRIITNGTPFDLMGTTPKFVRWNWLGF